MNKISIIARMTFREAVRRRIVLVGLVLGILFLIIFSIGFRMIYGAIIIESAEERHVQGVSGRSLKLPAYGGTLRRRLPFRGHGRARAPTPWPERSTPARSRRSSQSRFVASDVVIGKWLGFAGLLALYSLLMSGR